MSKIIGNKTTEQVITISPSENVLHGVPDTVGTPTAKTTLGLILDEPPRIGAKVLGETIACLDDQETEMGTDLPEIDDAHESQLPDNHPIFLFYDRKTVKVIFRSLGKTLPLLPSGLTFDAETLLHFVWNDVPAGRHRTMGTILKFMIDAKMVPLRKVPKFKSGGRVRYTKI